MSIKKPLCADEVPQEFITYLNFDKQWLEPAPSPSRPNKKRTLIQVWCPECGKPKDSAVNDIRNWCRGQRKSRFPIYHRKCSMPGRRVTAEGYVMIYQPSHPKAYDGKYVQEHILAMEAHLKRYLDRENESVHHIDGDKTNNSIENLQLRTRFHGKGQARVCGDCGSTNILHQKI